MKSTIIFLLFLVTVPCLSQTNDDFRYYDVEIIIFENLHKSRLDAESWPQKASVSRPEQWAELGLPYTGALPEGVLSQLTFVPLEETDYKLNSEAKTLDESDRYRVLMHLGWRQPGLNEESAVAVHIERLVPPHSTEDQPENAAMEATAALSDGVQVQLENTAVPRPYRLEGFVKIILSRYLHIQADLGYQEEPTSPGSWDFTDTNTFSDGENSREAPPFYHLLQTRRMRSGELHYLDNPVLSALVLITPYEVPEELKQSTGAGSIKQP